MVDLREGKFGLRIFLANLNWFTGLAIFALIPYFGLGANHSSKEQISIIDEEVKPETIRISIGAIGDFLAPKTQRLAQNTDSGTLDFNKNYTKVKYLFNWFDLMFANLETTISGKEHRFTDYTLFNAPNELDEAIHKASLGVVSPFQQPFLRKNRYYPLWVNRYMENQKYFFEALNCLDFVNRSSVLEKTPLPQNILDRISKSNNRTKDIFEENSARFSNSDGFWIL